MGAIVLAVDPGHEQSGFVVFDGARVRAGGYVPNAELLEQLATPWNVDSGEYVDAIALEQIESMGMAVGREVFETVYWTGRFFERARELHGRDVTRITRHAAKLHLCHSRRAKETNVRQALVDRFGGSAAKGTKATPGPLYGVAGHQWAALAVAVTWWDTVRVGGLP